MHYGENSGAYTDSIDAGAQTKAELADLPVGTTYFCAVTAYNALGMESDFSNEISFTVAPPRPPSADANMPGGLSDLLAKAGGEDGALPPLADPDHDGLPAIAEVFHGLDLLHPESEPVLTFEVVALGEERYLTMRYLVSPLARGLVTANLERCISPRAEEWHRATTEVISLGPSSDDPKLLAVVHRSVDPVSDRQCAFWRLRYEIVPTSP